MGIGELAYFVDRRPSSTDGQTYAYLSGVLLMMVGLVVAGPWLTMAGARMLARRANRPATLIAGRRLADNPRAGFHAVSGLMLALFVTSVATGVITTIVANRGAPPAGSVVGSAVSKMFWVEERPADRPAPTLDMIPAGLRSLPGIRSVTVVHANPLDRPDAPGERQMPGVIACDELARVPAFSSCPAGAKVAGVYPDLIGHRSFSDGPPVWPAAAIAPASLRQLPVLSVVVDTDGSAPAIERARTALATAFPEGHFPRTVAEFEGDFARALVQWQQLANVVILASLPIAGCSLATTVAGGLSSAYCAGWSCWRPRFRS